MKASKKDKKSKRSEDDDSENEADDEKSENSDKVNVDNSPKCIPICKLPDRLKSKKIVINICDTQYPVIEEIA